MAQAILPSYVRPRGRVKGTLLRLLGYGSLILMSLIIGLFWALFPPQMLFIPTSPILVAALLCLWALPDVDTVRESFLRKALLLFAFTSVIWPGYIALSLPGVPWINPQRIGLFALLVAGLLKLSTSSAMRREIIAGMRVLPLVFWTFTIFWITTLITIPLAPDVLFSLKKWANNQIYWTFMFVMAVFLTQREGLLRWLVLLLVVGAIIASMLSVVEYALKAVFWAPYIPNFLIGDRELLDTVLSSQSRVGEDIYRARSTFSVSITFAEYLSMVLPFALHYAAKAKSVRQRTALILAVLLIAVSMVVFTGARSGMNGLIIGVFGYAFYFAYRHWRANKADLVAASGFFMFPAAGAVFTVLVFTWHRLYVLVFGGGQHSFSTDARAAQWQIGLRKFWENPIGYGPGQVGTVIDYRLPGGKLTIDSFALTLFVEYGVIGMTAFFLLVFGAAFYAIRLALESDDEEMQLLAPLGIGLVAFAIIKIVLSQVENIPLMFILAGCVCGLALRARAAANERAAMAPGLESRPAARALGYPVPATA